MSSIAIAGGSSLTVDTMANILLSTPPKGSLAYATDYGILLIYDGTQWNIDSSYFTAQTINQDLGYIQFSNRIGYGKTYVTDKDLSNCTIGFGNPNGIEAQLRFNQSTGVLQIFHKGAWVSITTVSPGTLRDNQAQLNFALEDFPLNNWIQVFSGDSELLGLNGLPVVQGYQIDMGAFPAKQQLNGGTF